MDRLLVVLVLVVAFAVARWWYRRRSVRLADRSGVVHPPLPSRLLGADRTWIVFATQFCATCGPVTERLRRMHPVDVVHKILVEDEPDLAEAHAVRTAPTLLEVDADGRVVHSVAGAGPVLAYVDALAAT